MNFLAEYDFETAYKLGARDFKANIFPWYSKREEAPNETEDDR